MPAIPSQRSSRVKPTSSSTHYTGLCPPRNACIGCNRYSACNAPHTVLDTEVTLQDFGGF